MNWEFIVIQMIGVLIEVLVTYNFFDTMLIPKKFNGKHNKLYLFYVMMFLFLSVINISVNNLFVTPLCLFLSIFGVGFAYNGEWKNKLSLSLLLTIIFILSEMGVGMTISMFSSKSMNDMSTNKLLYFQGLFVSNMVAFIIVKIIGICKNKHMYSISIKTWLGIMIIPTTSIISVIAVVEVAYKSDDFRNNLYVLIIAICLIAANAFVFYLFEKELKIEEDKLKYEFIEQQLNDQKEYYDIMAKTQEKVNKTAHDMKNAMTSILGAMLSENYEDAELKLKKMIDVVQDSSYITYTGKITVDTMLNIKAQSIIEKGITFNPHCFMSNKKFNDIDFCIILGIVLDNAIEACEKINEDDRYIKLNIYEREDFISCYIENPTNGEIMTFGEHTTKTDKIHHGFGLENVKALIKENGGSFDAKIDSHVYKVSITYFTNCSKK